MYQSLNFFKSFKTSIYVSSLILIVGLFKIFGPFKVDNILLYSGLGADIGGRLLSGYPSIDPNVASTSLALGFRAAKEIISGEWPLWNFYEGFGQPLLGEMQSASMFPFTLLLLFEGGQIFSQLSLQLIGGIGMYLFLRKFGLDKRSAILGCILYQFNGVFTWLQNACFNPIAFFPWILFSVEGIYKEILDENHSTYFYIVIGSIFGALSIYSGFPEIVYLYGLFIFCWAILRSTNLSYKNNIKYFFPSLLMLAIIGLILSSPILVAFLDFLHYSNVGAHSGDGFSKTYNPFGGLILYFFPYALGPIFGIGNKAAYDIWGSIGGFIGFTPVYFAFATLFTKKNIAIKLFLFFWIFVAIGVSHGLPFISSIFFYIPLTKLAAVSRYLNITWIFSFIFLSVIFLDELKNLKPEKIRKIFIFSKIIIFSFIILYVIFLPRHKELTELIKTSNTFYWTAGSIFLALIFLGLISLFKEIKNKDKMLLALIFICLFECLLYNLLPLLAYPTKGHLNLSIVNFLKKNIEFQRFVNMPGQGSSIISPNFGSYYGIAQLNFDDNPSPEIVNQYIKNNLDPYHQAPLFLPDFPANINQAERTKEFIKRINRYGYAGVRYILANSKPAPMELPIKFDGSYPLKAWELNAGENISFTFSPVSNNSTLTQKIKSISLMIGNFGNTANGSIKVEICSDGLCEFGSRNLSESIDNSDFLISFENPLKAGNGALSINILKEGGDKKVAIWSGQLDPSSNSGGLLGRPSNTPVKLLPKFNLELVNAIDLPIAYKNNEVTVYEIANYRKYFSAKDCELVVKTRNLLDLDCRGPEKLIRLESYMPGWSVKVNGGTGTINTIDTIFQEVAVPAGRSTVEFSYRPKYFNYAVSLAFLVLLAITFFLSFKILSRNK